MSKHHKTRSKRSGKNKNLKNISTNSVVCISGMHRSGTSMVTRMLNLMGMHLGKEEDLMIAAEDNPEGFWENNRFVEINDAILFAFGGAFDSVPPFPADWPTAPALQHQREKATNLLQTFKGKERWGWKDPRNSLTLQFWQQFLPDIKVLVCLRHPLEVARSLQKRNGSSIPFGLNLWYQYNHFLLQNIAADRRFVIHFDKVFADPNGEMKRVMEWLGWNISESNLSAAAATVKSGRRHHRQPALEIEFGTAFTHIEALYGKMCKEAEYDLSPGDSKMISSGKSFHPQANVESAGKQSVLNALQKARNFAANNQFDDGIKVLKEVLSVNGFEGVVCNELAVLNFKKGDNNEAAKHFQRAFELDSEDQTILKNFADFCLSTKDIRQAKVLYSHILNKNTKDEDALWGMANVFTHSGKFETAEKNLNELLTINPNHSAAYDLKQQIFIKLNMDAAKPDEVNRYVSKKNKKNKEKETPQISIIIPVYNKVDFTRRCLETIYRNTSQEISYEIIVSDDASTDETPQFLGLAAKKYSNLKYVRNEENSGFAHTCNAGAREARGKFLLFLNNDTEPHTGWLSEMLKIFETHPETGIVGAKLLYPNGTIQHAGIEIHYRTIGVDEHPWPYHQFRGMNQNMPEVNKSKEVIAVTGACLMISKALFQSVNGLDETYPMYFEDIDLNLKVRRQGKKVIYCHSAVLTHYEGVSSVNKEAIDEKNLRSGEIFLTRWRDLLVRYLDSRWQTKFPVVWSAPFFNPSGYASEAISFALGLDSYLHFKVLHTNPNYSENFVNNMPIHWQEMLFRMAGDRPDSGKIKPPDKFILVSHQPGISLSVSPKAQYNIGRTMFETDSVPELWIEPCRMMDEIWVPSHFNFKTFSKAGIDPQKLFVVPEGIDTAVFNPDLIEPLDLPNRAGFNFLSIFEWTERKGWDVLLKAYFEAFSSKDDVCLYLRTYLLGHYDSDTETILRAKIDDLIQRKNYDREKLPRFELLPRQLPFQEMLQLYKAADAFVLPSRGEGWGRPYMEAMAMALPVIGTDWSGNTEFMNHENSYLIRVEKLVKIKKMEIPFYLGHRWAQPSKLHLKRLMREVFEDPQAAKEVGKKARKDVIENYSNDAVALVALRRLQQIEAELESGKLAGGDKVVTEKSSVVTPFKSEPQALPAPTECAVKWEGSQFVYHSFALINREISARLLESGVKLSAIPFEPDQYKPKPGSRFAKLRKTVKRPLKDVDVHVRHQWPPNLSAPKDGHWVIIQPWEFGSTPKEWVRVFTGQVDEVWVPSNFVRNVYVRDGIPAEKVFVIPNGIDPKKFHPGVKPYSLKTQKSLKLLFVGGTIYRKGIDLLLEAYLKAFNREDDVCLVIKDICKDSFYKGRNFADKVKEIQNDPRAPEIEYIDDVLPESQLIGLYTACDVLVHPYRGEGFGLPILEAMACGIPAIVPRGGACLDFCDDSNSLFISATKAYLPEAKIGERETIQVPYILAPDVSELISQLKKAQNAPALLKKLGEKASKDARTNWTWDHAAAKALERIRILKKQPVKRQSAALTAQIEDAREFMEAENFSVAQERFQEIYQSTGYLPALYFAAECVFRSGEKENALGLLNNVLNLNPNFAAAYLLKGEILQTMGQPEKAASEFLTAWQVDPTLVTGAMNGVEMLLQQNQAEDALTLLDDVIQNSPESEEIYIKKMQILKKLGRSAEIPEMLRQGLEALPASRLLWGHLIDFLQATGPEDAYRDTFAEFAQKFPTDRVVYNEKGVEAWSNGDSQGAIEYFKKAVADAEAHPDHMKNLVDAYLAAENFEDACQVLIRLLQKFPEDIEAYQKMANLYVENGDYVSAKILLTKAVEYQPENQYLQDWLSLLDTPEVYLAYQLINQNDYENARTLLEAYLMENPDAVSARLGLGSVLFFQKEFDAAEELYLGTLTDHPDAKEALVYLAKIFVAQKDEAKLNALKAQFPADFQKTPELRKAYVDLLLAQENFDEAVNELVQFIREFPGDADGYFLLGSLYLECGRKGEAGQCFSKARELDPDNASLNEVIESFMTEVTELNES